MTEKTGKYTSNSPLSDNHESSDDVQYALYCQSLEGQYQEAKESGLFEIMKVLTLDEKHSEPDLVKAVNYFNDKDGIVEKDAPMVFLTEREKNMVCLNGTFRPALYCMFLSGKFAESIENKTAFIKHSFKYAFDGE